jgi:hypothetical protein
MVSSTQNTSDITRSFFPVSLVCGVVVCAFYASWLEVAKILGVPISLTFSTLSDIPFVFRWFEFNFTLLLLFYVEDLFVVGGWFQFNEEYVEG